MSELRLALCSFSSGEANGIARMDDMLAGALAAHGMDVSRFLIDSCAEGKAFRQGDVMHVPLAGAYETLCEAFSHIDIVQFNGSFDPVVCAAAAAVGVPAVVEVMHNAEPGGMHTNIDLTVCVSEYVRRRQRGIRTVTVHNGIDLDTFRFRPRPRDGIVRVLQAANTAKALAVDLADHAPSLCRYRPDCRILLAGGRPSPELPCVRDYGVVQDMASVYHEADLLFMLGLRDPFGLVLAESMACGCVPIGWADSGAAEIITPERDGWLVRDTSEALQVLLRAVDKVSRPGITRMRREARRTVERRFSVSRCVNGYLAVYRALSEANPCRKRGPCRRERPVWMPLAQSVVFLGVGQTAQALAALREFVEAGRPLPGSFLIHPNGQAAAAMALLRFAELPALEGETDMFRALCALLRASGCRGQLLEQAERRLAGEHLHG